MTHRYIRGMALLVCAGLISLTALAQGAPVQIQDALAAFNQRLGLNLTLNDFNWSWSQQTYTDSFLGCPQPVDVPRAVSVIGYRFLFIWQNRVYEYRVSADRTILVFCGIRDVEEAPEEPALDPSLSNSLCLIPDEAVFYIRTRLAPGVEGRVTPPLPSNLRALPGTSEALVSQIPSGETFRVLNGPSCDNEGYVWWEVAYSNQQGWAAEGLEREYFLEPLPPAALPENRPLLSPENAERIVELAQLQGNFAEALAWSANNEIVVVGAAGSEGLWVYPLDQLTEPPRTLPSITPMTRVAFSAATQRARIALLGDITGSVRLWDIAPDATTLERTVLQGHDRRLTAVAFSPDAVQVASTGGYAYGVGEDATNNFAIALWNIETVSQSRLLRGHTDEVVALAYSPDARLLASASRDGSVRVWDVLDGSEVSALTGDTPATTVAFAPDGRTLMTGWADGALIPIRLVDFAVAEPRLAHTGSVIGLAYSPSGRLLASVGEDSRVIVWDEVDGAVMPLPDGHSGSVYSVVFSPDGTLLATLGVDNTIRLWGIPSADGEG